MIVRPKGDRIYGGMAGTSGNAPLHFSLVVGQTGHTRCRSRQLKHCGGKRLYLEGVADRIAAGERDSFE